MGWPETVLDAAAAMAAGMAALGCIYALVIARLVTRFGRRPIAAPLAEPPGISVLKPLCGLEPGLEAALATFCDQDYAGPVQIVFGVQSTADPAIAVVERLSARFSHAAIDLVVDAALHGANRKVSNLVNMAARAVHPVIMVSDSDIVAPRDCLARTVAELGQPGVAAVTSLYHGTAVGEGLWPRLEALGIDARFLPDIIAGISFGMAKPCFGSAIAMRAETLAAIGGFERVADELADDFKLGTALRERGAVAVPAGRRSAISPATPRVAELWHHDLRWQRTVRSLHPVGYLGSVVTHPVPFALAALALGGSARPRRGGGGAGQPRAALSHGGRHLPAHPAGIGAAGVARSSVFCRIRMEFHRQRRILARQSLPRRTGRPAPRRAAVIRPAARVVIPLRRLV